jgi:hypothetical protein
MFNEASFYYLDVFAARFFDSSFKVEAEALVYTLEKGSFGPHL